MYTQIACLIPDFCYLLLHIYVGVFLFTSSFYLSLFLFLLVSFVLETLAVFVSMVFSGASDICVVGLRVGYW